MTGDPAAIDRAGDQFEQRAAATRRLSIQFGDAVGRARLEWEGEASATCGQSVTAFTGQLEQVAHALDGSATALWSASSALQSAKSRMDEIIAAFQSAARAAVSACQAQVSEAASLSAGVGAAAAVAGPAIDRLAIEAAIDRLATEIEARGEAALKQAKAVEDDTNERLAGLANVLNSATVNMNLSTSAWALRSDIGSVNPWAPSRAVRTALFGETPEAYDRPIRPGLSPAEAGYVGLGVPAFLALATVQTMDQTKLSVLRSFGKSFQGLPRSFLADAAFIGALNSIPYSDYAPTNYLMGLGVKSATPVLLNEGFKLLGRGLYGANGIDWYMHSRMSSPSIAMIPPAAALLRGLSDLWVPSPSAEDPNNFRYYAKHLANAVAVGGAYVGSVYGPALLTGAPIDPRTAATTFAVPATLYLGGEFLYGKPPPREDPFHNAMKGTANWLAGVGANVQYLRMADGPGDSALLNLVRAGGNAAEAGATLVAGRLEQNSSPFTGLKEPVDLASRLWGRAVDLVTPGPQPAPPPAAPMVPQWSTEAASEAWRRTEHAMSRVLHEPQLNDPFGRATSAVVNGLDSVSRGTHAAALSALYPFAGYDGDNPAAQNAINRNWEAAIDDKWAEARASFQRAHGEYPEPLHGEPVSDTPAPVQRPDPMPHAQPPVAPYVVEKGENLWTIAEQEYGDGNRWKEIYALNVKNHPNMAGGDHIEERMVLDMPAKLPDR